MHEIKEFHNLNKLLFQVLPPMAEGAEGCFIKRKKRVHWIGLLFFTWYHSKNSFKLVSAILKNMQKI